MKSAVAWISIDDGNTGINDQFKLSRAFSPGDAVQGGLTGAGETENMFGASRDDSNVGNLPVYVKGVDVNGDI